MFKKIIIGLVLGLANWMTTVLPAAEPLKKLVIVAGRPSHPPRMHEFNAGVQLLHKCLAGSALEPHFVLNGWPSDESIFAGAAAVVFYMDGGKRHEVVLEEGRRLKIIDQWAQQGVGLGFMHFGVEVVPAQAGTEFKRWIGGHYEHEHSCNPIWEASFESFPDHPVARGVKPFKAKDEWYFNIRFAGNIEGNRSTEVDGMKFVPILVANPTDATRDGPYVFPKGPYKHIQENKGRDETLLWVVERSDGGRGMGFTGGHFHDNWANENFRKVVLNSFYWLAKVEVPNEGVVSLTATDINANLDPKEKK